VEAAKLFLEDRQEWLEAHKLSLEVRQAPASLNKGLDLAAMATDD